MRRDAEAHADEDRQRKELIEARNNADNLIYTAEKAMRDLGDKVPADVKGRVDDQVAKTRQALNTDDVQAIRQATEELGQIIQQIGAAAYQQQDGPAAAGPAPDQGQQPFGGDEDVVDGEFH
jgi:molecular chaperone DnaK